MGMITIIMKREVIIGNALEFNPLCGGNRFIEIPGKFKDSPAKLNLDEDIMSKHLMLIGGTGCGKTNVFYHIIGQLRKRVTKDDVVIIFDTKGDYYNHFGRSNDLVLGNSQEYRKQSVKWNIFKEIVADGWEEENLESNAGEISWAIYRESIERSKDSFFPNAARDLFSSILLCMLYVGINDKQYRNDCLYNLDLKRSFDTSNIFDVKRLIESNPKFSSVTSYIGDGQSGQALGVYAEMLGTVRKLLTGVFAEHGGFSVRDFVKKRGGNVLFVEYDLSIGNALAPLYSLFFDLALKEAMGRGSTKGNVYLVCDEFKLLPLLQHIEDGVNFGRSLGVKILAGLQSVNQLTEIYGEARGKNILAGFSSIFAFKANDVDSRKYITDLYGKNIVVEHRKSLSNNILEERHEGNTVEDWDICNLRVGEAVVGLPFSRPFKFQFDIYK